MKQFVWIGLAILTLSLLAACGAAPSEPVESQAGEQNTQTEAVQAEEVEPVPEVEEEQAEQPEAEEAASTSTEEEMEEASAVSDQTVTELEPEEEAMAKTEGHTAENCTDPMAAVEGVRFPASVWTAERISQFVGDDLVDPNSGLVTNFCKRSIDFDEVLSGGPPPDGIPPIDNPNFDPIAVGDEWLADVQPVIALALGNQAKAYPLAILTRHEIANDEIADVPVAVTFCPLCNAAVVFNREVNGDVLRFGVSGNLRNSDLIMWDDKTLSWWQQFTGESIVGDMTGTQLEMIPAQLVSWKDFKEAYPDGQVLSNNGRNYGQNPYVGYDSSAPFLFADTPDDRLRATERVLGYFDSDTAVAYPISVIADERVVKDNIDGQDIVIFYEPGQVSALDQAVIENSKKVGSAGMFIPVADGQDLTFSYKDGTIVDNETGSEWNVFGQAVAGELKGAELEPVLSHVHFWFAWAAFRPDTTIYEG